MARLFVAVWPPAEVCAAVAALARPERAGIRWTSPEQWHVTLRFFGRVDPVAVAVDALDEMTLPAAEAVLGPATEALGRHVLVAPVAGLDALAARVVEGTSEVGQAPEPRPFVGHLTLARSKRASVRPLAGEAVAGRWPVDEVTLVQSHLDHAGARYEIIHRVPAGR